MIELDQDHYPNAFPIPYAAPAANAPTMMVSITERYHFIPPTQLLATPNTPRKNMAVMMVAMMIPLSNF